MTNPIEATLTEIIGRKVELTVRGDRSFTISTEEVFAGLGERVAAFFGDLAKITTEHDDECGSFAYVEI